MHKNHLVASLVGAAILLPTAYAFGLPLPRWATGIPAWIALLLVWPQASRRARIQSAALASVGIAGLLWGAAHDVSLRWDLVLAGNALIIGMLAAVTFLRLIVSPGEEGRPRRSRAIAETALGIHLFGAVINMSMVFLVAQRLTRGRPLDDRQSMLLTRCFGAAAFWSPFFAAMGVALTWAPGAHIEPLILHGLPLAALALLLTVVQTLRHTPEPFEGYPLHARALAQPLLLTVCVLAINKALPQTPVIAIICLIVPPLSMLGSWLRGAEGRQALQQHLHGELPRVGNELALFLAAGVMAAGAAAVFASFDGWLPFQHFAASQASLLLGLMLLLSLVGVHPVISISVVGTLLAPLAPQPELLATLFLCSWAIGVAISPFSAMNLALQSRYGMGAMQVMRLNLGYGVAMYLASVGAFMLIQS